MRELKLRECVYFDVVLPMDEREGPYGVVVVRTTHCGYGGYELRWGLVRGLELQDKTVWHSRCAGVYLEYFWRHKERGGAGVAFFCENKLLGALASFRGWALFIGGSLVSRVLLYEYRLLF